MKVANHSNGNNGNGKLQIAEYLMKHVRKLHRYHKGEWFTATDGNGVNIETNKYPFYLHCGDISGYIDPDFNEFKRKAEEFYQMKKLEATTH